MRIEDAYFTVEAALVFPTVLGTLLFVIYMLFFQYDRCLLEQDLAAAALWGGSAQISHMEELEERTHARLGEMYQEKYVAWELTALEATVERNRFVVCGSGRVMFPFPGWNFWISQRLWGMEAEYDCDRLSPVTFIRHCRRLADFMNEDKGTKRKVNFYDDSDRVYKERQL